jgi:hypothetical protein
MRLYLLAPGTCLIIFKLEHSEAELERLITPRQQYTSSITRNSLEISALAFSRSLLPTNLTLFSRLLQLPPLSPISS